ncbi:hypothetical protein EYF80_008827 [Liparis tanakae]|uniref:Uncharacterized protein n=1 Tax=Liparis tanakae TaxID=230148 RepID=A0A4Z2IU28_9TELE|nr:hypothetical protein EYF80_008827 [Liparis tanakae]
MILNVKTIIMMRGRKNSVMVRTRSFERQQPGFWKAVDRKETGLCRPQRRGSSGKVSGLTCAIMPMKAHSLNIRRGTLTKY